MNGDSVHSAARTFLRIVATASFALCSALFVWVMSADTLVERAAQAFVKMRIEQEARELLGLDAKGNTAIAASGYKELTENQKVEFDAERGPKGMQAANIRPL